MDVLTVDMLRREKTRLSGVPDVTGTQDITLSVPPPPLNLFSSVSWGSRGHKSHTLGLLEQNYSELWF